MKKIISVNNTSNSSAVALLVARIGIAALMLTHGLPKLMMIFSGAPLQFPPVMGMSPELSLTLVVFAEVLCSLFILAGFGTRIAVLPLAFTMLVAALFFHAADPFSAKEPALLYLLGYAVLFIAGSGKYSIDYLLQGNKTVIGNRHSTAEDRAFAINQ